MTKRSTIVPVVALTVYVASIPLANWMIQHVGTQPFPGGPHTIPVGFGLDAPSGVLMIGLALVCRDIVQRAWGWAPALAAITLGALLSYFVAPTLAIASAVAFGLGEFADFTIYTPLSRRRLWLAVLASGVAGAVVDSLIFLHLAFGSTAFWQGNTLGKIWMSVLALALIPVVRRAVPDHSTQPVATSAL